jgi:hypothetical protein
MKACRTTVPSNIAPTALIPYISRRTSLSTGGFDQRTSMAIFQDWIALDDKPCGSDRFPERRHALALAILSQLGSVKLDPATSRSAKLSGQKR